MQDNVGVIIAKFIISNMFNPKAVSLFHCLPNMNTIKAPPFDPFNFVFGSRLLNVQPTLEQLIYGYHNTISSMNIQTECTQIQKGTAINDKRQTDRNGMDI